MKYKLILALLLLTVNLNVFGQTDEQTTLEIKGHGRLKVLPDIGTINITVKTLQDNISKAISDLNDKTDKIQKQLEKIGFKKGSIKTNNFKVQENRIYDKGKSYDSGYVGTQNILIEFENNKEAIGIILNSFLQSPTNFKFNFSFGLSDKNKEEVGEQLMKLALTDAFKKAKLISETSNKQLDKMIEIKYGTFNATNFNYGAQYRSQNFEDVNSIMDLGFDVKELAFDDYVIVKWKLK